MFLSCAENFFEYALKLFAKSGHTAATTPEFMNHSAKQFIYLDCDKNFSLSREQRDILQLFDNISRLFSVNGIVFFSLNLLTPRSGRSQAAHDIHMLIQAAVKDRATICLARHADEVIFSFAGYGANCLLSDWYSSDDEILQRLDIANMTIANGREYFCDFVSIFARHYYFFNNTPTFYDLVPINFFADLKSDITRKEEEEILIEQRFSFVKDYGNDYVEYSATPPEDSVDNECEFDLILHEAENVEISFSDVEDLPEQTKLDEYNPSEIDANIFDDPELLLSYIEKTSRSE